MSSSSRRSFGATGPIVLALWQVNPGKAEFGPAIRMTKDLLFVPHWTVFWLIEHLATFEFIQLNRVHFVLVFLFPVL